VSSWDSGKIQAERDCRIAGVEPPEPSQQICVQAMTLDDSHRTPWIDLKKQRLSRGRTVMQRAASGHHVTSSRR
jgi:hypothetical protein